MTFGKGKVSNISYMFINKETGEVEFIKKINIEDGETFAPILTMDGYVSAMFMKQSTSGMFWFSEEVDEATVDATIACLKANNPSYKDHNAICFGEGAHELEFKKGKFATYIFGEGVSIEESGEEIVESTEETGTTDETVTDTTDSKEAEKEAKKNSK